LLTIWCGALEPYRQTADGAEGHGPEGEVLGHSIRAGLATAAAAAGVQERVIAQTTGHKSMTVLRRYIGEGTLFNENAASAVGL
jgi:integrase